MMWNPTTVTIAWFVIVTLLIIMWLLDCIDQIGHELSAADFEELAEAWEQHYGLTMKPRDDYDYTGEPNNYIYNPEADEISHEDLESAAEYMDRIMKLCTDDDDNDH